MIRVAVLVFPGSNCDHDAYYVLHSMEGVQVNFVWHKETELTAYDAIIVPGGFSYGDYLRAGSIARFSPIMDAVIAAAGRGKPILGICNGFQILVEADLLPGALISNRRIKFLSQPVTLKVETNESVFTRKLKTGQKLVMPIAHKQGNYTAKPSTIKQLWDENRVAFTYFPDTATGNPNGSVDSIAGILNKERNVLGMMPHPERAAEDILNSIDGRVIIESLLGAA